MSFLSFMILAIIVTSVLYFFPPKIKWNEKEDEKFYGNDECANAYQEAFAKADIEYKTN